VAAGPRRVVDLPGFFIARDPVTCQEYLEFLHRLAEQDPAEAHRRCPRSAPDGGQYWARGADGRHVIPTAAWVEAGGDGRRLQGVGQWWEEDWPVVGVSWEDAMAYCRFASERLGRRVTLPRELEWEKAARGVDGRFYPWGNDFDATYCNGNSSHRDGMRPVVVGAFPTDESPYGVRGMAGNAADWCLDSPGADERETLSQHEQWRLMRGAGWASMDAFHRLASRGGYVMTLVLDHLGFRMCAPEQ
jgi:serine/threonine-protein kinase